MITESANESPLTMLLLITNSRITLVLCYGKEKNDFELTCNEWNFDLNCMHVVARMNIKDALKVFAILGLGSFPRVQIYFFIVGRVLESLFGPSFLKCWVPLFLTANFSYLKGTLF